jgi:hypothetical protein
MNNITFKIESLPLNHEENSPLCEAILYKPCQNKRQVTIISPAGSKRSVCLDHMKETFQLLRQILNNRSIELQKEMMTEYKEFDEHIRRWTE